MLADHCAVYRQLVDHGGASTDASQAANGKVVPTWNYAVVHARGRIQVFHDAVRLRSLVASLTNHHEQTQATPWSVVDAPEPYVQAQLCAIVGFEIEILDIVGKFKASQNRSDEDRAGVRAALRVRSADDLNELVRSPRRAPPDS